MSKEDKKALTDLLDKYSYQDILMQIATELADDDYEQEAEDVQDIAYDMP